MSQEQSATGNKRVVWVVVGIAILAIGLAVASKMVRENSKPAAPATTTSSTPETPVAATPQTPADTATTAAFSGTSWKVDDISASLEPGGLLKVSSPKVPFPLEGTWVIKDSVLTLSAMGKTITLKVDGDKLSKDGKVIERVQK